MLKVQTGLETFLESPPEWIFDHRLGLLSNPASIDIQLPVFSLYGRTRIPTRQMFDPIDALIIDLQDAGTRVYTFIYTMSYCMEAARRFGKKILVLDRPNPIGGEIIEGNCTAPDCCPIVWKPPDVSVKKYWFLTGQTRLVVKLLRETVRHRIALLW
jgi:uncharacterized protein YbbC (DUF1343 family)